jgi:hypothetical protein
MAGWVHLPLNAGLIELEALLPNAAEQLVFLDSFRDGGENRWRGPGAAAGAFWKVRRQSDYQ